MELARRYAYSLFFRIALPIRHFRAMFPNITGLHLESLSDLAPGQDPSIDLACRGILLDEPFHSRDETLWV